MPGSFPPNSAVVGVLGREAAEGSGKSTLELFRRLLEIGGLGCFCLCAMPLLVLSSSPNCGIGLVVLVSRFAV